MVYTAVGSSVVLRVTLGPVGVCVGSQVSSRNTFILRILYAAGGYEYWYSGRFYGVELFCVRLVVAVTVCFAFRVLWSTVCKLSTSALCVLGAQVNPHVTVIAVYFFVWPL